MGKLFLILFVCLFLSFNATSKTPTRIAAELESELEADNKEMAALMRRTDQAMNGALELAAKELRNKGRDDIADELIMTWEGAYQRTMFHENRGIGDHKPINQWLSERYRTIEFILGREFCINSHIATIHTINHSLPVVFNPCTFEMDGVQNERLIEYVNHFAKDQDYGYHGLGMEVGYWVTYLGCSSVTAGTGFVFVCGVAAGITEKILGTFVLPKMGEKIYKNRCEKIAAYSNQQFFDETVEGQEINATERPESPWNYPSHENIENYDYQPVELEESEDIYT